jgi:DNA-binding protein H-NS
MSGLSGRFEQSHLQTKRDDVEPVRLRKFHEFADVIDEVLRHVLSHGNPLKLTSGEPRRHVAPSFLPNWRYDPPHFRGKLMLMAINESSGFAIDRMSIDDLLALRQEVNGILDRKTAELQEQLGRIEGRPEKRIGPRPPRYRGPNGETWGGRGRRPEWLVDALKAGQTLKTLIIQDP